MNTKHKHIEHKLSILFLVMLIFIGVFLMLGVNFSNFRFLMGLRIPKLFGIILSGICISVSTLIFQTITNSRILTPSVMGLDAMYVFLQTAIFFIFHKFIPILSDDIVKFFLTIVAMVFITSSLQKLFSGNSKGKILYMVLIGMVTGTFLDSLSNSMQVIMDPNEFLILQSSLFASYNTINIYLLIIAYIILGVVIYFIIGEHNQLDVLSLGHDQAINLGLDYNRIEKVSCGNLYPSFNIHCPSRTYHFFRTTYCKYSQGAFFYLQTYLSVNSRYSPQYYIFNIWTTAGGKSFQ